MSVPLRNQVGSLFIVGIEGHTLSKIESAWLQLIQPSGVILFRRNIADAAQTHSLLAAVTDRLQNRLQNRLKSPIYRLVDLEGGTVDRLRDAIFPMPAPATVAATGRKRDARRHGDLIGAAARLVGFNTVLAPVLDLALPESRAVMQSRVVSPDPAAVIAYAKEFLAGLAAHYVLGCGKHFPGLGAGTLDSHTATPHINRDWDTLWREDLAPYRAVRRSLPLIMINHAAYPAITATDSQPASLSPFWIESILRKKIGYDGLVISDDMEMGGVMSQSSIEAACIAAIAAGTDLLEICHQPDLVLRGYEAVLHEAEYSAAFRKKVGNAVQRVATAKSKRLRNNELGAPPTTSAIAKLRANIERFTNELAKAQAK